MTKTTRILIATLGLAIALPANLNAEDKTPTLRANGEWLVISGYRTYSDATLPFLFAIKKKSIKAMSIWTERSNLPNKPLEVTTPAQIDALPATISITTDELDSSGANSRYEVTGLTHATAPAMLQKLLDAVSDPTASTPTK